MIYVGSSGIKLVMEFDDLSNLDSMTVIMKSPDGTQKNYNPTVSGNTATLTFGSDFPLKGVYVIQAKCTFEDGGPIWADPVKLYAMDLEVSP